MDFVENLEMTHIVRGGVTFICVIAYENRFVTHSLYRNTFLTIEKMEPHNYD